MVHGSLEVALNKDIDNKNSLLRSSTNPQDYYDPSIAFGLPPLGLGWMGAGDNKNSLLRSSTNPPGLLLPQYSIWVTSSRIWLDGSRRQ